jgi:hypothetical protein
MELTSRLAERITIEEAFIAEHSIVVIAIAIVVAVAIAIAIEIGKADTASSSRTTLDSEQWPSHFRTSR